jgi:hypothetical protein
MPHKRISIRTSEYRAITSIAGLAFFLVAGIALAQSDEAAVYEIDIESSDVHWLVYRAGAFARFGHNHIVSVGEAAGRVHVEPQLSDSRFELEIPVAGLVVDDPALWEQEQSEGFETLPSAEDIAGTRRNMLGDEVLDAEDHPLIRVTGMGPMGEPGETTLSLNVEIQGRSIDLTVPTVVEIDQRTLEASGSFRLSHRDLGMRPFSIMMGALQVADEMDFRYRLRARRVDDAN